MKIFAINALMCFCMLTLHAQNKQYNLSLIDSSVNRCLTSYYRPEQDSLSKVCCDGVVLIKFQISSTGRLENLAFSKGSPAFIAKALTTAMKNLELDRGFTNELKGTGKTIIKPFWYDYQGGCNFPEQKDRLSTKDFYKKYLKVQATKANYSTTLRYLLTFDNKVFNGIDCLLLSPASM